ncbi:hypothetical protein ACFSHT_04455 [Paraburkholderia silviterrae]|uniref:Uncharacterized protein n=1 Tax=Paraburkholderia silviterrae TaxID=2528715 RepID=A0A4R5M337_9BURK|nr:hypothetical protein [Paraburkholderia silviterrae]TDG20052.1 hypothetical protein EYW47_28275 [Paraburkholderia silviterrae]
MSLLPEALPRQPIPVSRGTGDIMHARAEAGAQAGADRLTHEEYRLATAWLDHLWNQAPGEQKSRLMVRLLVLVDEFEMRRGGT